MEKREKIFMVLITIIIAIWSSKNPNTFAFLGTQPNTNPCECNDENAWADAYDTIFGGDCMPLYERIRNLREDKDLTQSDMGKFFPVVNAYTVITNVEKLIFLLQHLLKLLSYTDITSDLRKVAIYWNLRMTGIRPAEMLFTDCVRFHWNSVILLLQLNILKNLRSLRRMIPEYIFFVTAFMKHRM